jgi:hypothetical protein
MSDDDLPMISLSSESSPMELTPPKSQKEVPVSASEPTRRPTSEIRKPGAAPAAAASDPRKASEVLKPGSLAPARPASDPSASRPAAPSVRPATASVPAVSAGGGDDEDPENLLREYADRQKTKMVRLEQQVVEYKKIVAERDSLRAKVEAFGKELQDAKRQLEASTKTEEVIKDLQGKIDAAILSNSILSEDKEKLKKALSQQTEHLKKAEERGEQSEKNLAELEKQLAEEADAREVAEAKVAAALKALQSDAPAPKAAAEKPVSEAATRPMPTPAAKAAPEDKPAAAAPAPAKAPAGRPATAPGRFSFLKK